MEAGHLMHSWAGQGSFFLQSYVMLSVVSETQCCTNLVIVLAGWLHVMYDVLRLKDYG